jgi:flagellar hook-length control protein FliK
MASVPNMRPAAPVPVGDGKAQPEGGGAAATPFATLLAVGQDASVQATDATGQATGRPGAAAQLLAALQRALGVRAARPAEGDQTDAAGDNAVSVGDEAGNKTDSQMPVEASGPKAPPADLLPLIEAQSVVPVSVTPAPAQSVQREGGPAGATASPLAALSRVAKAAPKAPSQPAQAKAPQAPKGAPPAARLRLQNAPNDSVPAEPNRPAATGPAATALQPPPGDAMPAGRISTPLPAKAPVDAAPPADDATAPEADLARIAAAMQAQAASPARPAAPRSANASSTQVGDVTEEAGADGAATSAANGPAAALQAAIDHAFSRLVGHVAPRADDPLARDVRPTPVAERLMEHQLDLARDSAWLDRLARDIAGSAAGDAPMRFRLHPETLGQMRVELSQGDRGVTVRLTVETEAARAIVADAQPRLVAEARAQGVRLADTHVDLAGGSGGNASSDPHRQEAAREPVPLRTHRGGAAGPDEGETPPSRRDRSDRYA